MTGTNDPVLDDCLLYSAPLDANELSMAFNEEWVSFIPIVSFSGLDLRVICALHHGVMLFCFDWSFSFIF